MKIKGDFMKKLIGITVIILAALICSFGVSNAAYAPTDRPYVEFQYSDGTPIQSDSGGYFVFIPICPTSPLPTSLTYKAKVHIPSGYTGPSVCRLKLTIDWLPFGNQDVALSFPSPYGVISDGDTFTFTLNTASWTIPTDCGPCSPPCNPEMVNVAAAFYQCNATNDGYIGTTSPSIQGLNIDKGCCPTLIELSSFTAKASNGRVKLEWVTESEIDNAGFNIWRADAEDGEYVKLNDETIPAKGSETKGAKYFFIDNIAKNRMTYFYKLEDIDVYGTSTFHGPLSATPKLLLGIFNK
jgi:hypothetical protein